MFWRRSIHLQVDQQLNQAKATLKQEQATLNLSRVTFQRDQDLLAEKGRRSAGFRHGQG